MNDNEILAYLKTEFLPVTLATGNETILQMISNAKRYWSTHSAFAVVRMFPTSGSITLQAGATTSGRIQLTPDYKQVVAQELETLKGEIKQAAPQIVAAAQQHAAAAPVAAPQVAPVDPAAPQAYQQMPPQDPGQ